MAGSTEMLNIPSPIPEVDEVSREEQTMVCVWGWVGGEDVCVSTCVCVHVCVYVRWGLVGRCCMCVCVCMYPVCESECMTLIQRYSSLQVIVPL